MTPLLGAAVEFWQSLLGTAGLVFLRIGAVMALLPAFGERSIPVRVRVGLTIAFTLIVAPSVEPKLADVPITPFSVTVEVLAGLAVGIALRLMVLVLQIAGTIAANVTSLSQILGGASVDPQPAMAHLLVVGGLALAVMTGLHVKAAAALILTYDVFPPNVALPASVVADWGTARVAHAFSLAFSLSAPFVLVAVIYNLALGAINRAMPQLMVAFVGAPAITLAGLVLLALSAPYMLLLWRDAFDRTLSTLGAG